MGLGAQSMASARSLALLGCVAASRADSALLRHCRALCADDFTVKFTIQLDESHRAEALVTVRESKAPIGANRFRELVNSGVWTLPPGAVAQMLRLVWKEVDPD